jgi:hypothetical protein
MFIETAKRLRLSLTTIADLLACGSRTPTAFSNTNYDRLLDDRLVDNDAANSESHFGADRRGCVLEFRHCLMANVVVGTGVHGYVGGASANESNEITDRR